MATVRRFISTSFGSAVLGGLVVAVGGLALIETGVIDTGGDSSGSLAAAPLTRPASQNEGKGLTVSEIYDRTSNGVAFISARVSQTTQGPLDLFPERQQSTATGSGFLIDDQGHVLTNAHVVEGASRVEVQFSEDGESQEAEVVGSDPSSDLALLKVDDTQGATPLPLGDSSRAEVGDAVVAIGNPFGLDRTVTSGIVSALQRQIQAPNGFSISDVIQTDAAINPGNSGGPLLDGRGRVIGVNAQIKSESGGGEGVGFAIPVDTVKRSLRELREDGSVSYGYLGVRALQLWPQLAERLDLEVRNGALLEQVEADSPAEDAGLRGGDSEIEFQATPVPTGGDVILTVNGRPLTRRDDLADVISGMSAGESVELELLRDGERRTIEVELGQRPDDSG
jgi:S1-C subfamily serine protease